VPKYFFCLRQKNIQFILGGYLGLDGIWEVARERTRAAAMQHYLNLKDGAVRDHVSYYIFIYHIFIPIFDESTAVMEDRIETKCSIASFCNI
jgi:hypothetical protein